MIQTRLFLPESTWRPPSMSVLPRWAGAKRIGLDIETCDPHLKELGPGVRRGSYIVGVSFAIEDGPQFYLPIRHEGGNNLQIEQVLSYLQEQAYQYQGEIVGANLQYDCDFLAQVGVVFQHATLRDVQLADPLLDELRDRFSLDAIAARRGLPRKEERLLREATSAFELANPKADLWRLPARYVGPYAEHDARLPLLIYAQQEKELREQNLERVWELESRVLPIALAMKRRGVLIDQDQLARVETWALEKEAEALARVKAETGVQIALGDVWKAGVVSQALRVLGVSIPRTPKTEKDSIKADFLKGLKHPVADAILRARQVNKIRTTFVQSIRDHMTNGRIHATFNQLRTSHHDEGSEEGAAYGRFSCQNPNLQQQPARDPEIGPMWRAIYVPDPGAQWCCADYSSQEPRMTVHYGVVAGCTGADQIAERFRTNPKTDLHQETANLCGISRKSAKEIFLGLCYGMGGAKLCRRLGLPTEWIQKNGKPVEVAGPEGDTIIRRFHEMVPFVRELVQRVQARAQDKGFIFTLSGRRCRFPLKDGGPERDWLHKALNRLIQGSSADQTKQAMIDLEAAGFRIQLQVHDEINLSVPDADAAAAVSGIMEKSYPLKVPSLVDAKIAANWGKAK